MPALIGDFDCKLLSAGGNRKFDKFSMRACYLVSGRCDQLLDDKRVFGPGNMGSHADIPGIGDPYNGLVQGGIEVENPSGFDCHIPGLVVDEIDVEKELRGFYLDPPETTGKREVKRYGRRVNVTWRERDPSEFLAGCVPGAWSTKTQIRQLEYQAPIWSAPFLGYWERSADELSNCCGEGPPWGDDIDLLPMDPLGEGEVPVGDCIVPIDTKGRRLPFSETRRCAVIAITHYVAATAAGIDLTNLLSSRVRCNANNLQLLLPQECMLFRFPAGTVQMLPTTVSPARTILCNGQQLKFLQVQQVLHYRSEGFNHIAPLASTVSFAKPGGLKPNGGFYPDDPEFTAAFTAEDGAPKSRCVVNKDRNGNTVSRFLDECGGLLEEGRQSYVTYGACKANLEQSSFWFNNNTTVQTSTF